MAERYQPCPAEDCGDPVDTWLAGTNVAITTEKGVMHADCYVFEEVLKQAIAQAENGELLDLGSFAQYVEEGDEDTTV